MNIIDHGEREDTGFSYRWEQGVNSNWEAIEDDIAAASSDRERYNKAKKNRITQSIRRGLIRYLVVTLDCSAASIENDYKPSRLEAAKGCISKFIGDYFDQNPISQLSLTCTRNRVAEKLSELSANPKNHIHKLETVQQATGLASLQNTLVLIMSILRHIPNYGHREALIVFSSLSTCDPGDIFSVIREARAHKVRVSVICLVAEIFVCRQIAELTGGNFSVALDANHLQELLLAHTIPAPEIQRQDSLVTDHIYMGFPKRMFDGNSYYGFDGKRMRLVTGTSYACPRCLTRSTDIPTQCCVCSLQLNSSSHIARSYHHLFPVPNFTECILHQSSDGFVAHIAEPESQNPVETHAAHAAAKIASSDSNNNVSNKNNENHKNSASNGGEKSSEDTGKISLKTKCCTGCRDFFEAGKIVFQCPRCQSCFCIECDLFIHDALHNCPGCNE